MPEAVSTDEVRIKALLENWADAVRRHDLPAIVALHEPDMVMFDLPPPLQCKGIAAGSYMAESPRLPVRDLTISPTASEITVSAATAIARTPIRFKECIPEARRATSAPCMNCRTSSNSEPISKVTRNIAA